MEIFINEKSADITIDTEKTLGDVLAGIEQWISPAGNRIRKISINGENIPVEDLGPVFGKDLKEIKRLDITISSFRELAAEALFELSSTCALFSGAAFEERKNIAETWGKSAAAQFMALSLPDIYELAANSFAGSGFSGQELVLLINERLREVMDPQSEIANSELLLKKIAERMEDLPLDMQTGKDQRAAETIQLFSKMGEKLFRILFIFKSEGLLTDRYNIDNLSIRSFLDEFNKAVTEISDAYRDKDTVLAGDIAEYELSPRILKFFDALKEVKISAIQILP